MTLARTVYSIALAIMIGYLLVLGRNIVVPIVTAVVAVYVLKRCEASLAHVPGIRILPSWAHKSMVLILFSGAVLTMLFMVTTNIEQISGLMPTYQANVEAVVGNVAKFLGFASSPSWASIQAATIDKVDARSFLLSLGGSIVGLGGSIFLIVIYAIFLSNESEAFRKKTRAALGDNAESTLEVFHQVNRRIGDYLAVKTLINAMLALVSFIILKLVGVDFALFWAVAIGLLNYIPYVGSLIGVLFPVTLTLAQFGSIRMALLTAVALTIVQTLVGNWVEPRMIGKSVNLSGIVVLITLVVWTALWGLAGAILSVPLTSMVMILLAANPQTRPIAIFMSSDGEV